MDSSIALTLTAQIVSAHVRKNHVAPEQLSDLIKSVYETVASVDREPEPAHAPVPAVSPRKSVQPDYIICLEDGKRLKMLKRHLMTTYHMTPEQYRAKWGLSPSYPMVAPNYAQTRSVLAKQIGLGSSGRGRGHAPAATDSAAAAGDVAAAQVATEGAASPAAEPEPRRTRKRT